MPEPDPSQPDAFAGAAPAAEPAIVQRPVRSLSGRLGLPAGASIGLHALLILSTTLLVWGIAWHSPRTVPEVTITFEEPRAGSSGSRAAPAAATAAAAPAAAAPAPPAASPIPESAPVLTGLSMLPAGEGAPPRLAGATAPSVGGPITGAAPAGSEVKFAGLGASSARSVVYVIDGSGPMVTSLSAVTAEVMRSINRLGPGQRFGVVVFRKKQKAAPSEPGLASPGATEEPAGPADEGEDGGPGYEWFNPALVRATPEAKGKVAQWLAAIKPGGRSTPLDGLRAAIDMKPDAVFLLSRSIERSGGGVWDLGLGRTMAELDRLNPKDFKSSRRPIVIKTIQFLDEDPSGIMQAIGKEHGGERAGAESNAYIVIKRGADLAAR